MAESWAAPATPRLRARPRPSSSARGLLELRDAEPGWLGALGPKVPRSDQERGDFRRAAGKDGTSRGPSRLACPAAPACGSASRKVCAQPRSMSPPLQCSLGNASSPNPLSGPTGRNRNRVGTSNCFACHPVTVATPSGGARRSNRSPRPLLSLSQGGDRARRGLAGAARAPPAVKPRPSTAPRGQSGPREAGRRTAAGARLGAPAPV